MGHPNQRQARVLRRLALASVAVAAMALPASAAVSQHSDGPIGRQGASARGIGAPAAAGTASEIPVHEVVMAQSTAANPKAAGIPASGTPLTGNKAIPATVLAAYRKAASTLAVQDTSCHLSWPLLAGIGKVETDHGRSWGAAAHITASGETVPTILGPVLDGRHGTAKLLDTDGGKYDHDRTYDRAVGPMQFVPSTWVEVGRDGNGDGVKDPNNIWDAALAAGSYLCGTDRNLADTADRTAAILAYNPSSDYVRAVLAWAAAYQKAGSALTSLESVPSPLVLGAGGTEGEDPFGDATSGDSSGSYEDAGYNGASNDLANIFGATPAVLRTPAIQAAAKAPTRPAKPARTPKPPAKPHPKPVQPATPTPTPKPTPTPTPTPTPKPTPAPTCVGSGVTLASKTVAVTAVPVDSDHDGNNDALRITAPITAKKAGNYTIGVRLSDSAHYRVTSTVETVTLAAGSQDLTANLPGRDIGDAGANGPMTVRITVRMAKAPSTCAQPLLTQAPTGKVDASTFEGWTTSLARLQSRVTDDIASGQIMGDAAKSLPEALRSPSAEAPDIAAFRRRVDEAAKPQKTANGEVADLSPQEQTRLDSLADRLLAQAAAAPAPTAPTESKDPFTDGVDPANDGVG